MYLILLVDDDTEYNRLLEEAFRPHKENCKLLVAQDSNQALDILTSNPIDVMVVDYLLERSAYNGDELIKIIKKMENGKFQNVPIIFNTGSLGTKSLNHSASTIGADYSNDKGDKPGKLINTILTIINAKNPSFQKTFGDYSEHVQDETDPVYTYVDCEWYDPRLPHFEEIRYKKCKQFKVQIVIIVATLIELKQVLRLLTPLSEKDFIIETTKNIETYYLGKLGAYTVCVVRSRMGTSGPAGSMLTAHSAIETWKPKLLVMMGICFAKNKKYKPADIILTTHLKLYESQRVGSREIIFRAEAPPVDELLFNRFRKAFFNWSFVKPDGSAVDIHEGPMLSGEKLVDDPDFKKDLFSQYPEAIAGEMEGAGIYAAAVRNKIPWIIVKAVSDWGDGKKHKDYQQMAAASSSSLTKFVFSQKNLY